MKHLDEFLLPRRCGVLEGWWGPGEHAFFWRGPAYADSLKQKLGPDLHTWYFSHLCTGWVFLLQLTCWFSWETLIFTSEIICLANCFPQNMTRHTGVKGIRSWYTACSLRNPKDCPVPSSFNACVFFSESETLWEWGLHAALHLSLRIYEVLSTFFNPCSPKRDCSQDAPTPTWRGGGMGPKYAV